MVGSAPRGEFTGASDIDILVVMERLDLKDRMRMDVYRSVEAPVELHVVSRKQLKNVIRGLSARKTLRKFRRGASGFR